MLQVVCWWAHKLNGPSFFLREGDQYVLDLFPGGPWGGRSPRALTRGRNGLFLRPEPRGHEVMDARDPLQYDLCRPNVPTRKKGPSVYEGAPLLLLLKRTRRGRALRPPEWRDSHGA